MPDTPVRIVRYGLALAASLETKIPSKFILILKVFRSTVAGWLLKETNGVGGYEARSCFRRAK
jgi:hypothetical protein